MQRDSRRGTMMIKSNPIPAGWVAHKLENNNTKEVLPLLWRFWTSCQASQPGGLTEGLGIPRESDLKAQWDLIIRLPQDWGNETPVLEGTNKIVCTPRPRKGAATWQETEPKLPAGVGGLLWRRGSAGTHHRDGGTGSSCPGKSPLA